MKRSVLCLLTEIFTDTSHGRDDREATCRVDVAAELLLPRQPPLAPRISKKCGRRGGSSLQVERRTKAAGGAKCTVVNRKTSNSTRREQTQSLPELSVRVKQRRAPLQKAPGNPRDIAACPRTRTEGTIEKIVSFHRLCMLRQRNCPKSQVPAELERVCTSLSSGLDLPSDEGAPDALPPRPPPPRQDFQNFVWQSGCKVVVPSNTRDT